MMSVGGELQVDLEIGFPDFSDDSYNVTGIIKQRSEARNCRKNARERKCLQRIWLPRFGSVMLGGNPTLIQV